MLTLEKGLKKDLQESDIHFIHFAETLALHSFDVYVWGSYTSYTWTYTWLEPLPCIALMCMCGVHTLGHTLTLMSLLDILRGNG